ncbi:hypothetical protein AOLI_G00163170 [Acnodon oligacanthus]
MKRADDRVREERRKGPKKTKASTPKSAEAYRRFPPLTFLWLLWLGLLPVGALWGEREAVAPPPPPYQPRKPLVPQSLQDRTLLTCFSLTFNFLYKVKRAIEQQEVP